MLKCNAFKFQVSLQRLTHMTFTKHSQKIIWGKSSKLQMRYSYKGGTMILTLLSIVKS